MAYDVNKIANDIKAAVQSAQEFATSEDGGTCNFDTAYIVVPRMSESTIQNIAQLAGVNAYMRQYMGVRCIFINEGRGQANRNTRMAEAISKHLEAAGYRSSVYYAID